MEEEGGDLVQAVEYQAVAPDDDGQADWAHTQNVVGEEPAINETRQLQDVNAGPCGSSQSLFSERYLMRRYFVADFSLL